MKGFFNLLFGIILFITSSNVSIGNVIDITSCKFCIPKEKKIKSLASDP